MFGCSPWKNRGKFKPADTTHVELTVSQGELIVSDSELNFSYTPSYFA